MRNRHLLDLHFKSFIFVLRFVSLINKHLNSTTVSVKRDAKNEYHKTYWQTLTLFRSVRCMYLKVGLVTFCYVFLSSVNVNDLYTTAAGCHSWNRASCHTCQLIQKCNIVWMRQSNSRIYIPSLVLLRVALEILVILNSRSWKSRS